MISEGYQRASMDIVKIPLRNKEHRIIEYALVSSSDEDKVQKLKWYMSPAKKNRNGRYAYTTIQRAPVSLHAFLMGRGEKGRIIDHINRNGLDNTRGNLRFVTVGQNNQNQNLRGGSSMYRGVSWSKVSSKWHAKCGKKHAGYYEDEEDCARAYDQAAISIFGPEAQTNFPNSIEVRDVLAPPRLLPKGVYKKAHEKTYQACIRWKKQNIYLGRFATIELAESAVIAKKSELENEKLEAHDKREIARNKDHIAVLPMNNSSGQTIRDIFVSDADWHRLALTSWSDTDGYAAGSIDGKMMTMHRFLMAEQLRPDGKEIIDHINGNRCDNRRENLRVLNYSGNGQNKAKKPGCASEYTGVTRARKLWSATITKDHKKYNLGHFLTEVEAGVAYNKEATRLYDNPRLNLFGGVPCLSVEEARHALSTISAEKKQ